MPKGLLFVSSAIFFVLGSRENWFFLSTKFKTNSLAHGKKLRALSAMGFSIFLSVFLCKPAGLAVHCENLLFHWWAIMAVCISNQKILSFFGERNKNLASRIIKPWVFQVNEIRSMSEPEKLKVFWWEKPNLFEWTEKTQDFLMRDANCHNCKSMNW